MYAGHDKYGGALVGSHEDEGALMDALESAGMEETLVVAPGQLGTDESSKEEVLLAAKLNVTEGGLMWEQEQDTASTYRHVCL